MGHAENLHAISNSEHEPSQPLRSWSSPFKGISVVVVSTTLD